MSDRCAHLKVVSGFLGKGGTGLEIAAAAAVGSWGPRHPDRCCSNQGPSGGNTDPRTLQERRGGDRKIQCKALLIGLVIGGLERQRPFFLSLFFLSFFFLSFFFFFLSFCQSGTRRGSQTLTTSDRQTDKILPWKTLRHLKATFISSRLTPPLLFPSSLTLGHWDRCVNDRNTAKLNAVLSRRKLHCGYLWSLV